MLAGIEKADALIVGSPIYFGTTTALTRAFFERLLFPWLAYTDPPSVCLPEEDRHRSDLYDGGRPRSSSSRWGWTAPLSADRLLFELVFGSAETLCSFDAAQFKDYSKFVADSFDPKRKAKHRNEVFPEDCTKAFEMGAKFAKR